MFLLGSCGVGQAPPSAELAAAQTLTFPISFEAGPGALDPAFVAGFGAADFIGSNLFGGLYRWDADQQREVPDIALGAPERSPDGLVYTFHLNPKARFSNGYRVRAQDFIYSWNRRAREAGGGLFELVQGYRDVAAKKSSTISGLQAKDEQTLIVTLTRPGGGYWLSKLTQPGARVVDQSVVQQLGQEWWKAPESGGGSGPFKLTDYKAKQYLEFEPVANWWGGSTGHLTKVHIEVQPDFSAQFAKYRQGGYDLIGYGQGIDRLQSVAGFPNDPTHSRELLLGVGGFTTVLHFNFEKGPFAGFEAGKLGRLALSQAIDRKRLASDTCAQGTTCAPATGGIVPKGSLAYLGDDTDVRFDKAQAKENYKKWDPDGRKIQGLMLTYPATNDGHHKANAENLKSQWKENLGITIGLQEVDFQTFGSNARKGLYNLDVVRWITPTEYPALMLALFLTNEPNNYSRYRSPSFDALLRNAEERPLTEAVPMYLDAQRVLREDVAFAALKYGVRGLLIKPYVKGAGLTAGKERPWTEIQILKH